MILCLAVTVSADYGWTLSFKDWSYYGRYCSYSDITSGMPAEYITWYEWNADTSVNMNGNPLIDQNGIQQYPDGDGVWGYFGHGGTYPAGDIYVEMTFVNPDPNDYIVPDDGVASGAIFMDWESGYFSWYQGSRPTLTLIGVDGEVSLWAEDTTTTSPLGSDWTRLQYNLNNVDLQRIGSLVQIEFAMLLTMDSIPAPLGIPDAYVYISGVEEPPSEVQQAADQISQAIDEAADRVINESFGYTPPVNSSTDDGLEDGDNLLDSLTDSVDDFNANIGSATSTIIQNINGIGSFVDGIYDCIPLPIQIAIPGVMCFLVIRKVVGR